jgi:hypothetical protein
VLKPLALRTLRLKDIYINTVHPKEISDIIIDNTDYNNPKIIKI